MPSAFRQRTPCPRIAFVRMWVNFLGSWSVYGTHETTAVTASHYLDHVAKAHFSLNAEQETRP